MSNDNTFTLSYVLTTFNKLNYLKEVMRHLLDNVKNDEEIIVIDGASTDGSTAYLQDLFRQKKIHQFISEPDKGEAHGFNKGIMMAKGELIKILTDDDAYYYPGIEKCKQYMLKNPTTCAIGTEIATAYLSNIKKVNFANDITKIAQLWQAGKLGRFPFIGIGLMIRKSKLPLIGLLNTTCMLVDCEYSLRVTSFDDFVWFDGITAVHVANAKSNYHTQASRASFEAKNITRFYNWRPPAKKAWEKITILLRSIYYEILLLLRGDTNKQTNQYVEVETNLLKEAFEYYDTWLNTYGKKANSVFIAKNINVH